MEPISIELAAGDAGTSPLYALLSQALVAFTIECDDTFEQRMPHRTTEHGATPGSRNAPWLVSIAMWLLFMQFVPADGITVRDLARDSGYAGTKLRWWLTRLGAWWGYLRIDGPRTGEGKSGFADVVIMPTVGGRTAIDLWTPLAAQIEDNWRKRFGATTIDGLHQALETIVGQSVELPDYLPILSYGLFSRPLPRPARNRSVRTRDEPPSLIVLLARALLAFALEFEAESDVSLAVAANLLRILDDRGVPLADIPRLAGVSKSAVDMALGLLAKAHLVATGTSSRAGRGKLIMLTAAGVEARDRSGRLSRVIEDRWRVRFGDAAIGQFRDVLLELIGGSVDESGPFLGLAPPPGCWRASLPRPATLPHYPMVLHRGGYPDGA